MYACAARLLNQNGIRSQIAKVLTMSAQLQTMTLGRFIRVTYDNFRLLIGSMSAGAANPSAGLSTPAPDEDKVESFHSKRSMSSAQHQPNAEQPEREPGSETPHGPSMDPFEAENSVAARPEDHEPGELASAPSSTGVAGLTTPGAPPRHNAIQPELQINTGDPRPAVTLDPESGNIRIKVGETSLTLPAVLESLLFVAEGPVAVSQLARAVELDVETVETALHMLDESYRTTGRGLRLQTRNGRYQLVSAPEVAGLIEAFLNLDMSSKLSTPALETLAVVAYRQPVTRAQIEAVRGVDCSGILRSLLQRGLIEETARLDAPGRPVLYSISDLFMQHFGLTGLHELPPLEPVAAEQLDNALGLDPASSR